MLTLLWHDSEVYAHENIKTKSWERERERERERDEGTVVCLPLYILIIW